MLMCYALMYIQMLQRILCMLLLAYRSGEQYSEKEGKFLFSRAKHKIKTCIYKAYKGGKIGKMPCPKIKIRGMDERDHHIKQKKEKVEVLWYKNAMCVIPNAKQRSVPSAGTVKQ